MRNVLHYTTYYLSVVNNFYLIKLY